MKTISVLLVDDDPFIREVLVAALEGQPGVRAQSYAEPGAAILAAKFAPPDVIVLDYTLPGTDGLAVYREMRRAFAPFPPVVFLTAREDAGLISQLNAAGAAGVLAKPFDPMSIAAEILRFAEKPATPMRDARLDVVTTAFRARLPQTMADIDAEWSILRREWQSAVAESLVVRVHKLAGAGGLFKMHAVGDAARAVEDAMQMQIDADRRGNAADLTDVATTLAVLWEAVTAAIGTPR